MAPAEASRGSWSALSEAPYTFGANRREIKGSFGSTRPGSTAGLSVLQLLHLRTGHASKATLMAGLKKYAFRGSQTTYAACLPLEIGACEGCLKGGMRADSVPAGHRDFSELKPMQEIGTDPVSLSTVSLDGNSVLNMGVCYGTKFMWVYPAKTDGHQSEVLAHVHRTSSDRTGTLSTWCTLTRGRYFCLRSSSDTAWEKASSATQGKVF
jgi:hypothetical protein